MPSDFESACLARALKTLSLGPLAVLGDEMRLPDNLLQSDARMPRPAWVGPGYCPGGILLLGKNPGGGSPSFVGQRSPEDAAIYTALEALVQERSIEAYRRLITVEGAAMRGWRFWRSISAVLDALGCTGDEVAIGNLVPFRTRGNKVYAQEIARAWHSDTQHLCALLRPRLVVRMTAAFHELVRFVPSDCAVLQFRRANGDSYITPGGEQDLEALRRHSAANVQLLVSAL